jgi:hypothetical protein
MNTYRFMAAADEISELVNGGEDEGQEVEEQASSS